MADPTSVVVEVVSGPTTSSNVDDLELRHARRALARLKSLLGRQGLLDLLAADIEKGNAFLGEMAERSGGELKAATTVLAVRGLKAVQFLHWLENSFGNEPVLLAAEPEHFAMGPDSDTTVMVVENVGPYVTRIQLPAYDTAPTWSTETIAELRPEADFPYRRIADISLPGGAIVGRILTQFGDTDEGFTASLTCYFPTACPEEIFEQHRQHLAVEFRNWIVAAGADQV